MTDQRHMSKEEFDKFIEIYAKALEASNLVTFNESAEMSYRSLSTYMWDAGRRWEKEHGDENN